MQNKFVVFKLGSILASWIAIYCPQLQQQQAAKASKQAAAAAAASIGLQQAAAIAFHALRHSLSYIRQIRATKAGLFAHLIAFSRLASKWGSSGNRYYGSQPNSWPTDVHPEWIQWSPAKLQIAKSERISLNLPFRYVHTKERHMQRYLYSKLLVVCYLYSVELTSTAGFRTLVTFRLDLTKCFSKMSLFLLP